VSKLLKSLMVDEYRDAFEGVSSCVLVDVSPLEVGQVEDFRRHLRENNVRLRVVRNRLAYHAVEGSPLEPVRELFGGPTAVAFDRDDSEGVATIKLIKRYLKDHQEIEVVIKGGLSEGESLDTAAVEELAKTPDRPQLQAMLASVIQAPGRGLASVMFNVAGGLARVIQARVDEDGSTDTEGGDAQEGETSPEADAAAGPEVNEAS